MAVLPLYPVNPKISVTFANSLRSILRHDPDIIMVGEIRDLETAEIAVQAALTGHLVFSRVLHGNYLSLPAVQLIHGGVQGGGFSAARGSGC